MPAVRNWGKVKVNNRPDWDGRVKDRIAKPDAGRDRLPENTDEDERGGPAIRNARDHTGSEIGQTHPAQRGRLPSIWIFEAQVPLQVRRSGRDNPQNRCTFLHEPVVPKCVNKIRRPGILRLIGA